MPTEPDAESIRRLQGGQWLEEFQDSVQWMGDGAAKFQTAVRELMAAIESPLLEAYPDVLAEVTGDQRLSLAVAIDELLGQISAELGAWRSGDVERAKDLRLAQHDRLGREVTPVVQRWCRDALNQGQSPALAALGRLVAVVLSIETGRDFERQLAGRDFHISDTLLD